MSRNNWLIVAGVLFVIALMILLGCAQTPSGESSDTEICDDRGKVTAVSEVKTTRNRKVVVTGYVVAVKEFDDGETEKHNTKTRWTVGQIWPC